MTSFLTRWWNNLNSTDLLSGSSKSNIEALSLDDANRLISAWLELERKKSDLALLTNWLESKILLPSTESKPFIVRLWRCCNVVSSRLDWFIKICFSGIGEKDLGACNRPNCILDSSVEHWLGEEIDATTAPLPKELLTKLGSSTRWPSE